MLKLFLSVIINDKPARSTRVSRTRISQPNNALAHCTDARRFFGSDDVLDRDISSANDDRPVPVRAIPVPVVVPFPSEFVIP